MKQAINEKDKTIVDTICDECGEAFKTESEAEKCDHSKNKT